MRLRLVLLALAGICILTACGGSTSSQTPPVAQHNKVISAALLEGSSSGDWPMFGYDPGHTGYVDALVEPHVLAGKLAWSQKFGPIFSSAVAGLGMVYIASTDGYLYALDQTSGAIVWRASIGNYLADATPALEGQALFVALHSSGIEALNAYTGSLYWTFDTTEKIQAPPLVIGSRVLVASRTTLWSLNALNGQLLWKFHRGAVGWPTTGVPAVAGNTVYVGLGTGTQFWALDLSNGHALWSFDTGDRITSAALVEANIVYVSTWHGIIFALDRMRGTKLWSYSLNGKTNESVVDGVGGSMALAGGKLYVGDYRGAVICLDARRGKLIWRFATGAQVLATPVVSAGLVYVGSDDGYFYALNTHTGRPAWRYATGEVRSSASLAGGHLYVGSLDGMMYAFS